MSELRSLYAAVGGLQATMAAATAERQEMKEDVKAILNVVAPIPRQLSELKETYDEHDSRLKSLERTREQSRERARLAKRIGGWALALAGTGLGAALLRKMGIDVPDPN